MNLRFYKIRYDFFFSLFLLVLFLHGSGYFLTGGIYDKGNPIKLIKYVLTAVYFFSFIVFLNGKVGYSCFFKLFSCWLLLFVLSSIFSVFNSLPFDYLIFLYIPFLFVFISRVVNLKILSNISFLVIWVSFFFMIFEFFFHREISVRFYQTGFRSVSIFVNPNAFGVVILLFCIILFFNEMSWFKKSCSFLVVTLMVFLSGSKTAIIGLILFAIVFFFIVFKKNRKRRSFYLKLIPTIIFVSFIVFIRSEESSVDVRPISVQSGIERLKELDTFLTAANECWVVPMHCNPNIYLDNVFIYAWVSLGLIGLVVLIGCFMISLLLAYLSMINDRNYFFITFFSLFWVMSMSTNLLNIWPTSFLFWIVFGYLLKFDRFKED